MLYFNNQKLEKYNIQPAISHCIRADFSIEKFGFGTFSFYKDKENNIIKIDNENSNINFVKQVIELSVDSMINAKLFKFEKIIKPLEKEELSNILDKMALINTYFKVPKAQQLNSSTSKYLIQINTREYIELIVIDKVRNAFLEINDFIHNKDYEKLFISAALIDYQKVKISDSLLQEPRVLILNTDLNIAETKAEISFDFFDLDSKKIKKDSLLLKYHKLANATMIKNFTFSNNVLKQIFNHILKDATTIY